MCRLGTVSGNPDEKLAEEQLALSKAALSFELQDVHPQLAVFVNQNFSKLAMLSTLGLNDSTDWNKSEDYPVFKISDVWWRKPNSGLPAILWMRHPERSEADRRLFALAKAQELAAA